MYGQSIRPLVVLLVSACFATTTWASDWTHARGSEGGTALVDGQGDISLAPDWIVPLGSGYSGIVVVGDRAVTAFADGNGSDVLAAFDTASGRELWRYRLDDTFEGHGGSQDGPIGTPTLADGVVYMTGPNGPFAAIGLADGKEIWRRHLVEDWNAELPEYGFSATPLVVGDQVILEAGIPAKGAVHGFDRATGALLWSAIDDSVGYQSPIYASIGGSEQIVAVTDNFVAGLEPGSGRRLWRVRHSEDNEDGTAQPVVTADGVLVTFWNEPAKLVRVSRRSDDNGGAWSAEVGWVSTSFARSYAVPAVHGGHIFGFRGGILHAVDAATGDLVWRSRAPGGRSVSKVGEHLLFLDRRGEVVVGEPVADGWREVARTRALGVDAYTPVSFADGRLFARNLKSLAAVSVVQRSGGRAVVANSSVETADWLRIVDTETLEDLSPEAALAEAVRQRESPWLKGRRALVSYVGEAEDVSIAGDFLDFGVQPLERLEGTDVWIRVVELPSAGAWDYRMVIDYGDPIVDPRNPNTVDIGGSARSWLASAGWEPSPWVKAPEGAEADDRASGEEVMLELESEARGDTRQIRVHLPASYEADVERSFPLLVVTNGEEAYQAGLATAAERLAAAGEIDPVVIAFVPFTGWQERGFTATPDFGKLLTAELIPRLAAEFRVAQDRDGRAIWGPRTGAHAALSAALQVPETYSRAVIQDLQTWNESEDHFRSLLSDPVADPETELIFGWSETGITSPTLGRSSHDDRQWLTETLTARGMLFTSEVIPGGSGWINWQARIADVLRLLYGS